MRVRRKGTPTCHYGPPEEVLADAGPYYVVPDPEGEYGVRAVSKADYEPLPETRWVDVTAECTFRDGHLFRGIVLISGNLGYRLRKVDVVVREDAEAIPNSAFAGFRSAFIIEKREPA